ncbi:hypothetical protein RM53_14460 [Brevundimonas nasdae]|uniref:Uncharacterized protein n=1 Tax=Brevundimonas nasdae TaxID=172043 RepID=A0A0B4CHE9_9CAUL|nr:RcnB family protein [Brevundimonas nasdae]KIC55907.1 hypothetical protein RM53_14460 [Brevundimonas nasdae]
MRRPLQRLLSCAIISVTVLATGEAFAGAVIRQTTVHTASRTVVIDRSHAGWWRGQPDFVAYHGPRRGYAYAPGYGYYAATHVPRGGVWIVGSPYPASMRRYVVINPHHYGLPPAPAGHGWYYAGNNFVLVHRSTWVVTRTVAGGW